MTPPYTRMVTALIQHRARQNHGRGIQPAAIAIGMVAASSFTRPIGLSAEPVMTGALSTALTDRCPMFGRVIVPAVRAPLEGVELRASGVTLTVVKTPPLSLQFTRLSTPGSPARETLSEPPTETNSFRRS